MRQEIRFCKPQLRKSPGSCITKSCGIWWWDMGWCVKKQPQQHAATGITTTTAWATAVKTSDDCNITSSNKNNRSGNSSNNDDNSNNNDNTNANSNTNDTGTDQHDIIATARRMEAATRNATSTSPQNHPAKASLAAFQSSIIDRCLIRFKGFREKKSRRCCCCCGCWLIMAGNG